MGEWQLRLRDHRGKAWRLTRGVEWSCSRWMETPADELTAQVCLDRQSPPEGWGEAAWLEIFWKGELLFEGGCDREEEIWNSGGRLLRLEARGPGALALDNEAIPGEYRGVTLGELFRQQLGGFGYQDGIGVSRWEGWRAPVYVVAKGTSRWEAFAQFCRRCTGQRPVLNRRRVELPGWSGNDYRLGAGELRPVLELRRVRRRDELLSRVWVRDREGGYSAGLCCQEAVELGIRRERCLIPSAQWSHWPQESPDRRMEEALERRQWWQATVLGIGKLELGDRVAEGRCFAQGRLVRQLRWTAREGTAQTQIWL